MFLSFYTFIILILIVQVIDSVNVNDNYHRFLEPLRNKDALPRMRRNVRKGADNKRASALNDETKLFDYVQEEGDDVNGRLSSGSSEQETLCELKNILKKLLKKLNCMTAKKPPCDGCNTSNILSNDLQKKRAGSDFVRRPRWGDWTNWSSCSVSCGKGREIRWRHCLDQCQDAETEMEEKTCQLPACGPGKFFGIKL